MPFSPPQSPGPQPPGVTSFIRDLLGMEETKRGLETNKAEEVDLCIVDPKLLSDNLTTHLQNYFPKDKNCNSIATSYFSIQGSQINLLFSYICKSNLGNENSIENDLIKFQIMESLYCAIEELGFPYPKGYFVELSRLGYRCLPQK